MVPSFEVDTSTQVQIRDADDGNSHSTSTLGKDMDPIILPPVVRK